jgi:hypothetical protein
MSFSKRIATASAIISELNAAYWEKEEIRTMHSILHIPYGYEMHISFQAQNVLKKVYTKTSKHIRFTPDFILLQEGNQKIFLCEYKVIKTPRYSLGANQWDSGQIEADAWENYINLINAGIDVAVVIYCPYHARPLLCDVVSQNWINTERTKVISSAGSGTPYVNVNLKEIRIFESFMHAYFNVPLALSSELLSADFFERIMSNPHLTTTHNNKSHFNNSQYMTGFNWDERYKTGVA